MNDGVLDIKETEEGYVLTRTDGAGTITMPLSIPDLLRLTQSAAGLRQRAEARLQPTGTGAEAIFVSPLAGVQIEWDSLRTGVILALRGQGGARTFFQASPDLAQQMVARLQEVLSAQPPQKAN